MDLNRYIERRRRLAWLALFWERLWPALWPALGVIGLFLGLALLDVLPLLPGWAHGLLLGALLLSLAAALYVGLKALVLPNDAEAQRRLERASGFEHRPLTALEDRLASTADPTARALWEAHRERVQRALRRLRVGLPRPGLAARDPYAVRAAVFLLLVIGLAVGGSDGRSRLARAVAPDFAGAPATPATLDIWINPPAYTGAPPKQLPPQGSAKAVPVPVGSAVLARVFGGEGEPRLLIDEQAHDFTAVDAMNHELRVDLTEGRLLRVVEGDLESELARWPLDMVPDRSPEVAFVQPPAATERASLRLDYRARDDYGLATVTAEIRLDENGGARNGDEVLELELPLGSSGAKEAAETSFHDLTPHPWAGMKVRLRLAAADGIGQRGYSEEIAFTLPERQFNHPVARALIEQRKVLTRDPGQRRAVSLALSAIATGPETFDHDLVAYLAMQIAANRLRHDRSDRAVDEVQDLLWDTALRIEDGGLSIAERNLRDAQQALMDALARDADDAEIDRLADELQNALQRYLQAMAEEMRKRAERGEQPQPIDPNARMLDSQQLQDMVDRARELSRMGAKDAAREMLQQLQAMLENLRMGPMMATPEMQSGEQAMQELSELMQRQQELLDRTFRQTPRGDRPGQQQFGQPQPGQQGQQRQQGQQGQQGEPSEALSGMAGEQEALRQQLAELLGRLGEGMGETPQALDRAEGAMGEARDALQQGQSGPAADAETRAIDQMAQGLRSLADQMARQMGQGQGRQGDLQNQGYQREDPLGRPLPNGGMDTSRVKIPEESDLQRARDILQELQRRSGDRSRPETERDYIDRLLERF